MIEIQGIEKRYGLFNALKSLSFSVGKGEIVGFLGPNGAGKTTTMRVITGFYPPTEGDVLIDGFSVTKNLDEVKKRIGYLPETPPLYPEMTVESYLKFVLQIKKTKKSDQKENLDWALEKCGLKNRRKSVIGTLSKGFRQRVGLAQAIIHRPPVIILDEPTVGLDPLQILDIRQLIQSFRGEHTLLLSTHILSEVTAVCWRAIIIKSGRIVHEQALEESSQKKSLEEIFLEVISKDDFETNLGPDSMKLASV